MPRVWKYIQSFTWVCSVKTSIESGHVYQYSFNTQTIHITYWKLKTTALLWLPKNILAGFVLRSSVSDVDCATPQGHFASLLLHTYKVYFMATMNLAAHESKSTRWEFQSGWPDWANSRPMGDCLLWKVIRLNYKSIPHIWSTLFSG
jgi:hypothetical protein